MFLIKDLCVNSVSLAKTNQTMRYISGGEKSYRVVELWSVARALLCSWYGTGMVWYDTVGSCLLAKY